jgi:hypothetical protein
MFIESSTEDKERGVSSNRTTVPTNHVPDPGSPTQLGVDENVHESVLTHVPSAVLGLVTRPQGIFAVIDGWCMDSLSAASQLEVCEGILAPRKEYRRWIKRKLRSLKRMNKIGIMTKEGGVKYHQWFEIGREIGFDLARIIGKGSGFRIRYRKFFRNDLKEYEVKVWEELAKANGKSVKKLQSQDMFYAAGSKIRKALEVLSEQGWLLRKEDRGTGFMFVRKEWEEDCMNTLIQDKLDLVKVSVQGKKGPIILPNLRKEDDQFFDGRLVFLDFAIPKVYFLPKSHKDEVPIPGRPIVSYCKTPQKYARRMNKVLEAYIIRLGNNCCDFVSVEKMTEHIAPQCAEEVMITGDIKSMFTEIPRIELLSFVESQLPEILESVKEHLQSTVLQYYGSIYKWNDGIDMGSKVSPALARAFVSWKESAAVYEFNRLGLRIGRYVDDVGITFKPEVGRVEEQIRIVKEMYEIAIGPKLKIEWSEKQDSADKRKKYQMYRTVGKIFDVEFVRYKDVESAMDPEVRKRLPPRGFRFDESRLETGWKFDDRGRKPGISSGGLFPRSVWVQTVVEGFRRIETKSRYYKDWKGEYEQMLRKKGKKMKLQGMRSGLKDPLVKYGNQIGYTGRNLIIKSLREPKPVKEEKMILSFQFHPLLESPTGQRCIKNVVEELHGKNTKYSVRWKYEGVGRASALLMKKCEDVYVNQRLLMRVLKGASETEE